MYIYLQISKILFCDFHIFSPVIYLCFIHRPLIVTLDSDPTYEGNFVLATLADGEEGDPAEAARSSTNSNSVQRLTTNQR